MSAVQGARTRALAAEVIAAVRFDGQSLKTVLPDTLGKIADPRDRALCEAIVFEAIRWLPRYEFWLSRLLERPLPRAVRSIHALLLAGLAQLDAIGLSDYAAISTSAEAARVLRQPRLTGLVNAVLRRFVRERESLHVALEDNEEARCAHPRWLIEHLRADWPEAFDALIAANNTQAPMWLRVNRRHGTAEAYLADLRQAGIEAEPAVDASMALRLDRPRAPATLPGWEQGKVSVQDLSAQCVVPLLAAAPGHRVLDIGAAPGGKTAQILETFDGLGEVVALDIDATRLARITDTLTRLGVSARCVAGDGTRPGEWWDGQPFDRILLDAPCSATGVIRRQPDIKWHRQPEDLPRLVAHQAALLDAAWPMLRPGGRLVYATCSVLRDENDRQIDAFLARTPSARALREPDASGRVPGAGVQRFPTPGGGDGFFHAVLEKAADADAAGDARRL